MTITKAWACGAGMFASLLTMLACGGALAQQADTPKAATPSTKRAATPDTKKTTASSPRSTSTAKKSIARESERATAARRRVRDQMAAQQQYAWQFPGYGYGTPPVWGYGGYGYGYAPGWNYPGYGTGYYPSWGGYSGGYAPALAGYYPGALGTGAVSGGVVGGAVSTGFTANPYIGMYPGDKFGVNRGTAVNGGTYFPGQGVIGTGVLPRRGR